MVILGLDISTSCVGYAFTKDKKILDMGFIDIKKQKTPKEKVQKVLEILNQNDDYDTPVITANLVKPIRKSDKIPLTFKIRLDI